MSGGAEVVRTVSDPNELFRLLEQRPQHLFAVVDACDEPLVPPKVRELGTERAVSLYRGSAEVDYWAIAPYLVRVDAALLEWIATHLWEKPWGFFALADVQLSELRKHFRRFLTVLDPDGERVYFRFYDPRVLPVFLASAGPAERRQFVGPVEKFLLNQS